MENNKPNCYRCKYKGIVPGDAHICCNHPVTKTDKNPLAEMMAIFASVGRVDAIVGNSSVDLNIKANEIGIRKGWFNWPYNFDPIWLENCDGFEEKE